jgi:hypothetical protein
VQAAGGTSQILLAVPRAGKSDNFGRSFGTDLDLAVLRLGSWLRI